jgi:ribosome-associated protein
MLYISRQVKIPDTEIDIQAVHAAGAGGQNVNKVSSAVHLRFDIRASSLPKLYKERLLALKDRRISGDGVVVIKAQRFRSQLKNRDDALDRLSELIRGVTVVRKERRATKPTRAARERRLESKVKRGRAKLLRRKVHDHTE